MKSKRVLSKQREFYAWIKCVDPTLPGDIYPPCGAGGSTPACSSGLAITSGDRPPVVGARRGTSLLVAGPYPKGVWECCDVGDLKLKADAHRHGRWSIDGTYAGSVSAPIEVLQFVGTRADAVAWYFSTVGVEWRRNATSVALVKFRTPGGPKQRPHAFPIPAGDPKFQARACSFPKTSWGSEFASHLTEDSVLFDSKALQSLLADARDKLKMPDTDECQDVRDATTRQQARMKEIRLRKTDMSALLYVVDPSGQAMNKQHTMDLVDRVRQGLLRPIFELKAYFARGRPWGCCADIPTAIGQKESQFPWHPAFPAGHATFVYTMAALMGDAVPAMRVELGNRAKEIADDRVIGGFHWPSDNDAGQQLANLVVDRLRNSSDMQRLLRDVASEWP